MRFLGLRVKLIIPILHVRDGVSVIKIQALLSAVMSPCWRPNSRAAPIAGRSACVSKLGIRGARRFAICSARLESIMCLADLENRRKFVIVAPTVTIVSNCQDSSIKASRAWISPYWHTFPTCGHKRSSA
ncbi:hypothetical protein TcCL_ESM09506 [Trypanosoma cruzi]|nr:hypothetical protein TcCL_ESM09506 [Trypanosoma cruzi]